MRGKLKAIAIGLFVVAVLICAGIPALLWSLGGGSPKIAVDYEAKLNERAAAVPEEDRAWPIYRDVMIAFRATPRDEIDRLSDASWRISDRTAFEEQMAGLEGELQRVRQATAKPGLGFVTSEPQPQAFWDSIDQDAPPPVAAGAPPRRLIDVLLPHLGGLRTIARLLEADAWLAAKRGDADRFLADIDAMLAIADHTEEHTTLINQLVAVAVRVLAFERIMGTIGSHPDLLDESALERLGKRLAQISRDGESRLDLTGERHFFEDIIQRVYTDDGKGNGLFTAAGSAMLASKAWYRSQPVSRPTPSAGERITTGATRLYASDRRTVTETYERFLDGAARWGEKPLWERGTNDDAWLEATKVSASSFPQDPGMMMVSMIAPAYTNAYTAVETQHMQREATAVAIALARFRAKHGDWPTTLSDLVPDLIEAVPVDRFTGDPLRYTLTDEGPLLYSVGMDRDDDGGRAAERASRWVPADRVAETVAENPGEHDGDWVFLGSSVNPTDEDAASD